MSLLFNFQGASCLRSRERQPCYYITFKLACQYLFQTFFKFFLPVFYSVLSGCLADSFVILSQHPFQVKHFFQVFSMFFTLLLICHFRTITTVSCCAKNTKACLPMGKHAFYTQIYYLFLTSSYTLRTISPSLSILASISRTSLNCALARTILCSG